MRKIILSIIGLMLIIAAYMAMQLIIDSKQRPKPRIKKEVKIITTDTITNTTVKVSLPANGKLQAKRRVELFAEVTGIFKPTGLPFKAGQHYTTGQTLISIDHSEFYAQVQSARSNLINQITAIMPDLRLDYPASFNHWQTYLANCDSNKMTAPLPQPINDQEKYFITGRNIYTTYYNIKNLENRLQKFKIKAPFDGVLTEVMVTEGTLVRNGQQLGEYIKTGSYELAVAVSSEFADLLQVNKQVLLENVTNSKIYTGAITRINGKIDQESQSITAVIEVSHQDLKEGMYLKAQIETQQINNAVELDRNLLQNDNQLFTVNDTLLELKTVQPVSFNDNKMVVKGLKNGTVILTQIIPGAYQGMIVKTEQQLATDRATSTSQSNSNTKS